MWEQLPSRGRIPIHRPDTGAILLAEVMTMRSLVYVKDVDGLYTDDPKKNPKAEFLREVSAAKLLERNLPDLPIERAVLEILADTRNLKEIRIVNGLVPGNLRRALDGEDVGTRIHR
jgi:molybdenum storage protein